ncbi:hypothetical protein AB9P05_03930 [Roseivirga sp. BDSF3-8]|uniref:hypothetical protein n=1 Tax=Roseivirga sp. BDSF3-8 TaxID=3241598 RepID=UPI00353264B8
MAILLTAMGRKGGAKVVVSFYYSFWRAAVHGFSGNLLPCINCLSFTLQFMEDSRISIAMPPRPEYTWQTVPAQMRLVMIFLPLPITLSFRCQSRVVTFFL